MMTLTILLTNYNRPKLILSIIDSIVNQKLKNIQLDVLIIDDASTKPIDPNDLKKYNNVRLHRLNENLGAHGARNIGISLAKGELILLSDDDDPFLPDTLQGAIDMILSFPNYHKYPAFKFSKTNCIMPDSFMLMDESHFYNKYFSGDLGPILNKKVFMENNLSYPESEYIKQITAESLLFIDIARRFKIPTWNYNIIQVNGDSSVRLTNPENWIIKAKSFSKLQESEIEYMETHGFDQKYSNHYLFKIKGLCTYLLLNGEKQKARRIIKEKLNTSFPNRIIFYFLTILPKKVVYFLLKIYRKRS